MTDQFSELLREADRILANDAVNEQLVLIKTAKGNIYHTFQNAQTSYDPMRDIRFMDMLVGEDDAQIACMVVLWNPKAETVKLLDTARPYSLEVPGWCLRRGLLELAPANKDAQMLLIGAGGYNTRTLGSIQPPQAGLGAEWKRICALRGADSE